MPPRLVQREAGDITPSTVEGEGSAREVEGGLRDGQIAHSPSVCIRPCARNHNGGGAEVHKHCGVVNDDESLRGGRRVWEECMRGVYEMRV
jgi:hypothetical protein